MAAKSSDINLKVLATVSTCQYKKAISLNTGIGAISSGTAISSIGWNGKETVSGLKV